MTWPFNFGTATSPVAASHLDDMFNQCAAMDSLPCTATGTNAISLSPQANVPALTAYTELCGYRFRAVGTSSGLVTAQYNGLGYLNVYHSDGVTAVGTGDIVIGQQYCLRFSQALNSGVGGFFLEAPSMPAGGVTPWGTPGGRLSFYSTVPIYLSTITSPQVIYYVPYVHQWCPIYNGSNVQMYQFSSPISNQSGPYLSMGGAANFPAASMFDLFITLISGVPSLVAIQWTNTSTRATTLATLGGFLTNAGTATAQTGANTSMSLPQNQGTFLGSFYCPGGTPGASAWILTGSGSGGASPPVQAYLSNYYNAVQVSLHSTDTGAGYTYTSATPRAWRGSGNNALYFVQASSELAYSLTPYTQTNYVGVTGTYASIGYALNQTGSLPSAFNANTLLTNMSNSFPAIQLPATWVNNPPAGLVCLFGMEVSDGASANTFNPSSNQTLLGNVWL
jgi:hypothetical protein